MLDEPGGNFPLWDMAVSGFAGVVGTAGSADTRLTREAGQLAGQDGGPNKVRPSMTHLLTPHKFGMIGPGRNNLAGGHTVHLLLVGAQYLEERGREHSGLIQWNMAMGPGLTVVTLTASMAFSV